MKRSLLSGLFLFCLTYASGQDKPVLYVAEADVLWAGVDRASDLLLVLQSGEVQKINKEGKKIGSHSFAMAPTLVDPMDGTQSFYYSRSEHVYGNISSDQSTVSQFPLNPAFAVSPWLICPALHELWIFDSADFSLKKTKLHATAIDLETPTNHLPSKKIEEYTYLREYQNYVFLLDKAVGIHVFNSLGKFLKIIEAKEIAYFGFIGEEIYFKKGNELVLVDLYSNERRKLALPMACDFALLIDDKLFAVSKNKVSILPFQP